MTAAARSRLGRAQRALLEALLADAPAPPGFDAARLRIAAATLRHKQERTKCAAHKSNRPR